MALHGPIIVIEDDKNDAEVIAAAIKNIGIPNQITVLTSCQAALDYLYVTEEQPYVILCDIRMPGMDGLAFRKAIIADDYLRKKSIPFVYLTGMVSQEIINTAYELDVQGFFQKATSFDSLREQLLSIFMYWKQCLHPNSSKNTRQQ